MWIKPRVQTRNTRTDWRTTHEPHTRLLKDEDGCSSSPLLMSHEQFLASGRKLCPHYTDTCPLHFKTNTKLLRLHPWSLSARSCKGPDCKSVQTTSFLFSKPPTFLHRPSFLPVCPSLFFWNSLQKPETTVSCDTNFPNSVAHWLQLNHTIISTL